MKTPRERLLTEVLVHEDYVSFRARLFDRSLGEMRRRRWIHRRNQILALAACLVIMWWLSFVVLRQLAPGQAEFPCEVVRSVPLTSGEVVNTTGFMAGLVKTMPGGLGRSAIELVHTDPQFHGTDFLSDQQLLALFQGHPLALVNPGPGKKQLRFLNPEDEAAFVGN